uniref:Uncharacterized protein n=1 Tax=Oryza sativa subsp. japonica TaxID=39947 RepID=Q6YTN5_ORYSJ|nr:hypothetical protein [Oryza sativa Japonica Group]BAD03931.1 hypothetical protein [Oryza sativa Japonica Group]
MGAPPPADRTGMAALEHAEWLPRGARPSAARALGANEGYMSCGPVVEMSWHRAGVLLLGAQSCLPVPDVPAEFLEDEGFGV